MIYNLPLWLRRAFAVSLVLVALGLIALITVVPFMSQLAQARDLLEQERTVYGRLLDATQTSAPAHVAQPARSPKASGWLIEGESETIRLALLQSQVVDIIAAHAVKPRTARMLPTRERHTLKLIGVQLQLTASIEQLQRILLQIEAHRPILLVDSLHLTPSTSNNADDDRGLLEARLDIVAIESPPDARPSPTRLKAP